jgi:AcrR family transcriptional regulator
MLCSWKTTFSTSTVGLRRFPEALTFSRNPSDEIRCPPTAGVVITRKEPVIVADKSGHTKGVKKPAIKKKTSDDAKKRGAGRPPATRGEDTRREIIEAATRLFAENEGELTSFESIASAAGVSRTALYYYFPTKEDLARAVLMPSMDWDWWRIALTAASAADSFQEKLYLLLSTCLDRAILSQSSRSAYFGLVKAGSTDDEIRVTLQHYVADMRESVRELVREGMSRGDLVPGNDLESVVEAVSSGVSNTNSARVNAQIAQAVSFVTRGIASNR